MRILAIATLLLLSAPAHAQLSYQPPGELVSGSGTGRRDALVYVPDMRFPIEEGPAYANSQVYGRGGYLGPGGDQCDTQNYSFPWHDNYCETRGWSMPMCPSGTGHQGQDIRPATCANGTHWAVAVTDGTITQVGTFSVYLTDAMGRRFDYLHMSNVQVSRGQRVRCGDRLGTVSNRFGSESTTIHLHFNTRLAVRGQAGQVYAPPYASLIQSYQRLERACTAPPPLCEEADLRAGRTCRASMGRDVCIGAVAATSEGCPEGTAGQTLGRTCSCVADGSGGARWDCPDVTTCRPIDECASCAGNVSGGGSTTTPGTRTCAAAPGRARGSAWPLGLLLLPLLRRRWAEGSGDC